MLQLNVATKPLHDCQEHRVESIYEETLLTFETEDVQLTRIIVFSMGEESEIEIAVTDTGQTESP